VAKANQPCVPSLIILPGIVTGTPGLDQEQSSYSPILMLMAPPLPPPVTHPHRYGGLILASIGLAAVTKSEARLALGFLLWFVLEQKTFFEERELSARYPQEYEQYKLKVKKFIPFLY